MVKLTSLKLFLAIFGVLTLIAICESAVVTKAKARTKVIVKKKKIILTTTPPTTTSTTTIEPELSSPTIATFKTDSSGDPNDYEESLPQLETDHEEIALPIMSQVQSSTINIGTIPVETSNNDNLGIDNTRSTMKAHRSRTLNNCEECVPEDCETPPATSCPIGLIMDFCSCCYICASVEGNRCYNSSLNLPYNPNLGVCGPGLTCQLRNDLEPYEQKEALCECGAKTTICGTDNQTYPSECKLHEASHLKPNLAVKNWHPCYSSPTIAKVDNATVGTGDDVSLSCEVRAFPPPVIHWKFLAEDSTTSIVLPGDDSSVVVTIRGGPEQIMTTSWIQIVSVTPKRQGVYFCLAKNEEGMTQSSAIVSVYKNNN